VKFALESIKPGFYPKQRVQRTQKSTQLTQTTQHKDKNTKIKTKTQR